MTQSPWQATRDRQDFSEELFLSISFDGTSYMPVNETPNRQKTLYKITLHTTAGYFELPNYMNGELPGPLLDYDPTKHCGDDCNLQSTYR